MAFKTYARQWNISTYVVKFKGDLVFAVITLVHVGKRNLVGIAFAHLKAQSRSIEVGRAPIPTLDTQLAIQQI